MHILVSKRDWSNSVFLDLELINRWFKKYYPTLRSLTVCKSSSTIVSFQHWYALLKLIIIFSFEYFDVTLWASIIGLHHCTTAHVLIHIWSMSEKVQQICSKEQGLSHGARYWKVTFCNCCLSAFFSFSDIHLEDEAADGNLFTVLVLLFCSYCKCSFNIKHVHRSLSYWFVSKMRLLECGLQIASTEAF